PIYSALGADPAMFAGSFLAIDMGGLQLAQQMTVDQDVAMFSGVILGSMMRATVVFSIPVSLGIIKKEDHSYLATGMLAGFIAILVGGIVGGLIAGYSFGMIITNLIPIFILAALVIIVLWKIHEKIIKGFTVFGHGVVIVATAGLAIGIIDVLTGLTIIPGIAPIGEGIEIVGSIAIVL